MIRKPPRRAHVTRHTAAILEAVRIVFDVSPSEIFSASRFQHVNEARNAAAALLRDLTGLSWQLIASTLHRADHTTPLYGVRCLKRSIDEDPRLKDMIGLARKIALDAISETPRSSTDEQTKEPEAAYPTISAAGDRGNRRADQTDQSAAVA